MNFLWVFVVFGVLFIAESVIIHLFGAKNIKYTRYFDRSAVFVGDCASMIEEISNDKPLPLPWVRVESKLSPFMRFRTAKDEYLLASAYHKSLFSLGAYKKITRSHNITFTHRGAYTLDSVSMTTGDLIGVVVKSESMKVDSEIIVYPAIEGVNLPQLPTTKWQGDTIVNRFVLEDPFAVNGIRGYMPGDAMKTVHWKASARTGDLYVKTYDHTAFSKLIICLNIQFSAAQWDQLSAEDAEAMEYSVSQTAALALDALSRGMEVGLWSNACIERGQNPRPVRLLPGGGEAQRELILDTLARLILFRVENIHTMLSADVDSGVTGMDYAVLSRYVTDEMRAAGDALIHAGNRVAFVPLEGRLDDAQKNA